MRCVSRRAIRPARAEGIEARECLNARVGEEIPCSPGEEIHLPRDDPSVVRLVLRENGCLIKN
jgi:hypothetical protein